MYKKIVVPLILALVAALTFSNVAYAAADATSYVRRVGTIISIDTAAETFKIALNNGTKVVVHTNSDTAVRGKASSVSELATGMYVNVTADTLSNGHYLAVKVNVLKVVAKAKVTGWVTAVDASSFTIKGKDGNTYTFQVTGNTTVSGKGVTSYSGLDTGMKVRITYSDLGDAGLRATAIVVLKK
jgi:hypothetical protein